MIKKTCLTQFLTSLDNVNILADFVRIPQIVYLFMSVILVPY